jgi:hypothetical protein
MAKASHSLSAPREGCNPGPAALHEWRAAVSVWAALLPRSEASLIAQEVAHA